MCTVGESDLEATLFCEQCLADDKHIYPHFRGNPKNASVSAFGSLAI